MAPNNVIFLPLFEVATTILKTRYGLSWMHMEIETRLVHKSITSIVMYTISQYLLERPSEPLHT